MEVLLILGIISHDPSTCAYCGFWHFFPWYFPIPASALKIWFAILRKPVWNAYVSSCWTQDSIYFIQHSLYVCCSSITTLIILMSYTVKESNVALSKTTSKLPVSNSIFITSIVKTKNYSKAHLTSGQFSLHRSIICLITVSEISMFVELMYPSLYISSVSPIISNLNTRTPASDI